MSYTVGDELRDRIGSRILDAIDYDESEDEQICDLVDWIVKTVERTLHPKPEDEQ